MRRPIYVETLIDAPIEDLWAATQDPALHQRWDVRFGNIDYLPRVDGEPQRFTYSTTVAPGVTIAGTGESIGDRHRPDGSHYSGLRFWAHDKRSIIESGAGYWRYIPTDQGVRFLTRYDYRPRWGPLGAVIDRYLFRPLFGWATAWSFDRLKLWLERGVTPEASREKALIHAAAVAGQAGIWIYQGLVPKLLTLNPTELDLVQQSLRISKSRAAVVTRAVGLGEVAFGIVTLARSRKRWPFVLTAAGMPVLAIAAVKTDKRLLTEAFNPVTLNFAAALLAFIALLTRKDVPSARRTLRSAPDRQPDVEPIG